MSGTGILCCNRCGAHGMSLAHLLEHQARWHGRVPLDVRKALASQAVVAAYVAKNPGSTARGIAAETTLDHYQVMRRLVDAERLGLVHKGEAVIREAHRLQVTWWPGPEVAAAVSGAVQEELL